MRRVLAVLLLVTLALVVVEARVTSALVYSSGTITATGNSGWLRLPTLSRQTGIEKGHMRIVPANLATDETLDVTVDFGYSSAGVGSETILTFTQITSTNVAETKQISNAVPSWYRINWTIAGTTPSMDFSMYATMIADD
jgi:hypothetical protein